MTQSLNKMIKYRCVGMWVPFSISHKKPDWWCTFILQPSITHIPISAPLLELCPQEDPVLAASCSAWADCSDFDLKLQTEAGWKYQQDKGSHTGRPPQQFLHLENRTIPKLWSIISSPVWLKGLFQIWLLLAIYQVLKQSWWISYP